MDKPTLNRKGFTLIEMLLVISIMCTLTLLNMSIHNPKVSQQDTVQQISDFIYQAKINAMVNKDKTTIVLSGNKLSYSSSSTNQTVYLKNGIVKKKYTFSYNSKGNIYKATTINFYIDGSLIEFVFQVGSGSFYVR